MREAWSSTLPCPARADPSAQKWAPGLHSEPEPRVAGQSEAGRRVPWPWVAEAAVLGAQPQSSSAARGASKVPSPWVQWARWWRLLLAVPQESHYPSEEAVEEAGGESPARAPHGRQEQQHTPRQRQQPIEHCAWGALSSQCPIFAIVTLIGRAGSV